MVKLKLKNPQAIIFLRNQKIFWLSFSGKQIIDEKGF